MNIVLIPFTLYKLESQHIIRYRQAYIDHTWYVKLKFTSSSTGYELSLSARFINESLDIGLNIFYSGRKYTEKDWVRLKVRHYPLQTLVLG